MNKVQKLLSVGDTVFSAQGGQKMEVLSMNDVGFETEEVLLSGNWGGLTMHNEGIHQRQLTDGALITITVNKGE